MLKSVLYLGTVELYIIKLDHSRKVRSFLRATLPKEALKVLFLVNSEL